MKRSRSGTASPASAPRAQTIFLLVALAIVLAFAASAIFGLRRGTPEPPPATPAAPDTIGRIEVPDARGRVEVLNGAGRTGLARLVTDRLRTAGFDVVQFGNARQPTDTSSVLDRVGQPELAREVAGALGITRVRTVVDSTRYVDVTVVLGKDWKSR